MGVKEPGLSAWVWPLLPEGTWGSAAPDMFDPEHRISWLSERDNGLLGCTDDVNKT